MQSNDSRLLSHFSFLFSIVALYYINKLSQVKYQAAVPVLTGKQANKKKK